MRRVLRLCRAVVVASVLVSQSLAAQAAKVRPSAALALAALLNGEIRASVEPLVLGRTAVGVSFARWWGGQTYYAVPLSSQLVVPVGGISGPHPGREYMVDLHARVYPVSFSSATPRHGVSVYLGGLVGYHRREFDQTLYPCFASPCPLAGPSSGVIIPCQVPCQPVAPEAVRTVSAGVEPGAELGVRMMLLRDLLIEIGGWARLITFPDPTGRFVEGQVESRLTLAVGLSW